MSHNSSNGSNSNTSKSNHMNIKNSRSSYKIFEDREHAARLLGERLRAYLIKNIFPYQNNEYLFWLSQGWRYNRRRYCFLPGRKSGCSSFKKNWIAVESQLAIGAVMHDGTFYPNEEVIDRLNVPQDYIDDQIAVPIREIERRLRKFRGIAEYLIYDNMREKIIILVDDGIATGATVFAAIKWIIKQKPKQIIVAIPVGPRDTIEKLRREEGVNDVVVLNLPSEFLAVGQFYREFLQVDDDTVTQIMEKYNKETRDKR